MKQRELEMRLQKLEGFSNPQPNLEQYPTPAKVAADILYTAHALGDIEGRSIIDLGCGTGVFSIGARLLGAASVVGIDIDGDALRIAARNAEAANCAVEFQCKPVVEASGRYDTCLMNPPFGSQNRHADIPFLEKAMEIADVIYTMHNAGTMDFLRKKVESMGRAIGLERNYKFEIRHTFDFHRKEKAWFDVTLIRIVRP